MKKTQAMAAQQGVMHIAGHICEGQTLDARGHDVRVTIIKGGKSVNGYYYDEQALQHIAHMIDGARAYADHGRSEADQQTRSVRDMIGFYKDAQHFPPGAGSPHGRVDATLHVLEAAAWLWSIIQEAVALDRPDLIGLSIDIFGNWQPSEERQAKQVTRVLSLNSCDIVTRPSAGGSFQRILHHHDTQGEPFSRIYPNMDKPYSVSDANAIACSSLLNVVTQATGPKISSRNARIRGVTFSKTVGE